MTTPDDPERLVISAEDLTEEETPSHGSINPVCAAGLPQ